jgi:LCP family protein required for cell wall assembly
VPRDLWVPVTGVGDDRINTAFAAGGAQLLIDTVRSVLQIEINHYVEIDFRGFKELVQTIGGVPMYFDTPLQDENSGLYIPTSGCVTLNGDQALAFARARHLQYLDADGEWEDDPTADLGRITRQQLFMRKAMDKASTLGLGDITRINRLIDVGTKNVKFDDGLKTTELVGLIRKFSETRGEGMTTYSLPGQPFETTDGASVLALDAAAAQPILDIFRGASPVAAPTTTALSPAQVAVTVLNGTGVSGQAREAADQLGLAGFVVAKVGDASAVGEAQTSLRYSPGHKPEADMVAALLQPGITLLEDASAGNGVVLTTGADFRGVTVPEAPATSTPGAEATTTTVVGIAPPAQTPPGETCT